MRAKRFHSLAAGALGLALLTGCGNAAPTTTDPYAADPPQEQPAADTGVEDTGIADGVLNLVLRGHETLGELVTDAAGHTLYRFDEDSPDEESSACYGDCADNWIPVAAAQEMTIPGGDELLDSFEREDGIEQVTLDGWPLYRHAADAGPGDTNGEGAQEAWYAASPVGTKAQDEPWTEGYCPQGFQVRQDPELGDIVVDDEGFTLYRFEEDSANPPEATCFDECAEIWPPVLAMSQFDFGQGLDTALFGEVEREHRLSQVTLNGWALYRYAEDNAPGEVNGHGVGDVWYAVTPEGAIAGGGADSGNAGNDDTGDSDSGYGDDDDSGSGY
ncbi:hypothetical protein [Nocardiopsis metallicus]|uniref:Putative lipoprotein with Yx(FWY)xxD motif n=1 Tax=Nocardiopsis metallicus TaxID=179819 RepID=A0A840W1T5_9ACTN|nr:hypothetical protein [Nocardiopsis metallicus]MBB5490032.1 putative lipoprotein with Yx(FWY)xxD motif [Nocardiopsis metallicus]